MKAALIRLGIRGFNPKLKKAAGRLEDLRQVKFLLHGYDRQLWVRGACSESARQKATLIHFELRLPSLN